MCLWCVFGVSLVCHWCVIGVTLVCHLSVCREFVVCVLHLRLIVFVFAFISLVFREGWLDFEAM